MEKIKEVSKEQMEKLSENFASIANETKELTNVFKDLVVNMAESGKKMNLIKLKSLESLASMWFEKILKSKWYNRWYYRLRFNAAAKEHQLCAGKQYLLESEYEKLLAVIDDIDKKNEENN